MTLKQPPASYLEAVREIESFGIMPDRPPALEVITKALERSGVMSHIDPKKVVVVAGTNGKGSTSVTLAALLATTGMRVGLYTSPHLVTTTERISLQGKQISEEKFLEVYLILRPLILELKLSHFETLTFMAAHIFFAAAEFGLPVVDTAVFEVGLGGLWDATNAIPHHWCVITPIDFDHQNILGNDLLSIAKNKFGIVGKGARVIHAPFAKELSELVSSTQVKTSSQWTECEWFPFKVYRVGQIPSYELSTKWGAVKLSLLGKRAAENSSLALCAFEEMGFDVSKGLPALSKIKWPGRMDELKVAGARCPLFLSGDHNPQGIESLLEILKNFEWKALHILVGIGKDKDAESMLEKLFQLPRAKIYLTETPFKGRSLTEYGKWLELAAGKNANPVVAFQEMLKAAQEGDLALVTGSLYLVGKIYETVL